MELTENAVIPTQKPSPSSKYNKLNNNIRKEVENIKEALAIF